MPRNLGTLDRVVRTVVGVVLLAFVFVGPQTVWGYLGLLPLVTALFGYCPFYQMFGLSTYPATRGRPGGHPA